MKISILDQAPISQGSTSTEALHNMVASAMLAEALGYHRFWIAEHHNTPQLASSAPEISMAYIAGKTQRIRLGSGGTMMMHYSPYKMAETFKTLAAYAPGRIDFGAGRAPGGDGKSIAALAEGRNTSHQDLYTKLYNVLQLLKDEDGNSQIYQNIVAQPQAIVLPEPYMLGSSGNSAAQAGFMGMGYAYVQFFNGHIEKSLFDAYKNHFKPSDFFEKPNSIACYFVTIGNTKEEAEYQGYPADLSRLFLYTGRPMLRLSPEEAHNYPLSEAEKAFLQQNSKWQFKGTAEEVANYLYNEQALYGFDEAMICTIPYDQAYKLDSYRKLAAIML